MKKFSKKQLLNIVDNHDGDNLLRFFAEKCMEAATDAARVARGSETDKRNLAISIAALMVWLPIVRQVLENSAGGGDIEFARDLLAEKTLNALNDHENWIFDNLDALDDRE